MDYKPRFRYTPSFNVPQNPADLPGFLFQELQRIAQALSQTDIQLPELNAAPAKPTAGMVVLADGTNWDPGSGAGFYGYYAGSWAKLG